MDTTPGLIPTLRRRQALQLAGAAALTGLAGCSKREAPAVAAAPAATATSSRAAFEAAGRGTGFAVGPQASAHQLRVFFDPQCPHCATLWLAAKPLRERLYMVWMPVAFINPNSMPQGALILNAPNPVAQMDKHEGLLQGGQGGLPVRGAADDATIAKIEANTALWKSLDATSVPHLVYRAGAEGPYGTLSGGLPTAELAQLLGL